MAVGALAILVAPFAVHSACAQGFTTPLHIGATESIRDEYGVKLAGSWNTTGALVQLLWASNGLVAPPAVDGTPDAMNPLVEDGTTGIGIRTDPALVDEGIFGMSLARKRPQEDEGIGYTNKIFVRVFNAKELVDASFYGDSQIFTIRGNEIFTVEIGATTNALDPNDDDNDGLNNSWEKSLGTRADNPDSDRDGVSDGDEVGAGTGAMDPDSYFAITKMFEIVGDDIILDWFSVTGRQYVIQFASEDLGGNPDYVDVSPVINAALSTNVTTTVITNGVDLGRGHYRIRVLPVPFP